MGLPLPLVKMDPRERADLQTFLGEHFEHVYYDPNTFPPYYYYNGFVWVNIWSLSLDSLRLHRTQEHIEQESSYMSSMLEQNDFLSIFNRIEKKALIHIYMSKFYQIPDDQKYDVFRKVYQRSEYNFDHLSADILEEVFATRYLSTHWKQSKQTLEKNMKNSTHVTVYRGECTKSTPLERAWSWTLSRKIAQFFAVRFADEGILHQADVPIHEILAYLPDSGEEEVLISPQSISLTSSTTVTKN